MEIQVFIRDSFFEVFYFCSGVSFFQIVAQLQLPGLILTVLIVYMGVIPLTVGAAHLERSSGTTDWSTSASINY